MAGELVHVALGGTISMRIVDGLAVPELGAEKLAEIAGIRTLPIDLATVGGPQLDFTLLTKAAAAIKSAQDAGAAGVIVTLGTDAIEEVGAFLAYTGPWTCNVVVTGSMDPGGEPDSDGPSNLRDAAAIAIGPSLTEPVIVFAGQVAVARAVVKVSGLALDAFASHTVREWTVAEVLEGGTLAGATRPPAMLGKPGPELVDVPILMSALSVGSGDDLDLFGALSASGAVPALVCVANGAGNLTPAATAAAHRALELGAVVAIATRALDRRLSASYGYPGGSGTLVAAGAVLADGMSAHRLRMFLLIALSQGLRGAELKDVLTAHIESLTPPNARVTNLK